MSDLVFVAVLVVLFALSAGYVRLCDRITAEDTAESR